MQNEQKLNEFQKYAWRSNLAKLSCLAWFGCLTDYSSIL